MIITLKEVMGYGPCSGSNPKQYGITRISLANLLRKESIRADHKIWVACHVLARRDRDKLIDFANDAARAAADAASAAYYAADAAYAAAAADAAYYAAERQKQVDYLINLIGDR